MRKLVFATNNAHKLEEIRAILGDKVEVLSLKDIRCEADIPETADTLEGNAALKAEYIHAHYGMDCFADDTGLEVEALDGAPGVYSARYAGGEGHDSEANMKKLLAELEGKENRKAQFRTAICPDGRRRKALVRRHCEGRNHPGEKRKLRLRLRPGVRAGRLCRDFCGDGG